MIYGSCDKRFTRRLVFKRPAKEPEVAICGRDSEGCEKTCEGSLRILLLDYRQRDGDNVVLKLGLEALRARPPTAIGSSLSSVKNKRGRTTPENSYKNLQRLRSDSPRREHVFDFGHGGIPWKSAVIDRQSLGRTGTPYSELS